MLRYIFQLFAILNLTVTTTPDGQTPTKTTQTLVTTTESTILTTTTPRPTTTPFTRWDAAGKM